MEGIRAAPVIPRNCVVPVQIKRPRMPRSRLALSAATALVPVQWTMPASAAGPLLPSGGNFVAGAGAIAQSGASLSVNQTSNRAIIDWRSFSIGAGGKVTINNGNGATLNRVTGAEQSRLAGSLSASGSVYLINPNGVLVLPGGRIVTGGDFVASSLSPGMAAFMRGGSLTLSGTSQASVINNGDIVSQRGDVMLIARDVASTGSINAPNGTAALVAAQQVVLREARPGDTVSVELPGGNVTASGAIQAASVRLNAAGGNIYALAGNNGGLIEATGTSKRDGRVWLSAGGDTTVQGTIAATGTVSVQSGGTVAVSGKIAAASKAGVGGLIDVNGGKVILSGAHLDASGAAKGGTIALGGAKNGTTAAGTVVVDAASTLLANGGSVGNGGSVSIWSSGLTDFRGLLEARGGSLGQGGAAEVSSAGELLFAGAVKLDGGAGLGRLLLDPSSVNIINAGGAAANPIGGSIVDPQAIVDALATANVTLTAGGGGITVSSPVSWASSGTLTLNSAGNLVVGGALTQAAPIGTTGGITLIAGGAIYIRQNITGTGGLVDVLVNANANDTGGGIVVGDAGVVSISTTGNITLGGGAALDGSGYAVGNNSSFNYIGIALEAATTLAAGGTVTLRGQGGNIPGGANYGISVFSGTLIGAGVTLQGTSGISTSGAFGVILGNYGFLSAGATKAVTVEASTGDLVVAGVATYTGNEGVGNAKAGITLNTDVTLTADKGSVSLTGINTSDGAGAAAGISLAAGDTITAANTIAIWGSATAGTQVAVSLAGTLTTTGTLGQIDLTANRIALGGTIVTSGAVRITPVDFGWNVDLGSTAKTAANTLELSAAELGLINAGTLAIGSMNSGGLTQTQPLAFTTVNTLQLTGGTTLTLAAPLSLTTPAGISGAISLVSGADMYIATNVVGAGGHVDLMANSNASGIGGGIQFGAYEGTIGQLVDGSIYELNANYLIAATGNITFGGGIARDGSGYAVGLSTYFHEGINFFNYPTIVAGGSVTMRGTGGDASYYPYGINMWFGTIQASEILLSGVSGSIAYGRALGVLLGANNRLTATNGNIVIVGNESSVTASNPSNGAGIYIMSGNTLSAPGGAVELIGIGGAPVAFGIAKGVQIDSNTTITAANLIYLEGIVSDANQLALDVNGTLGGAGSSAYIALTGDRIAIGGTIVTSGLVSIAPLTSLFDVNLGSTGKTAASTLELSATELAIISAGALEILSDRTIFLTADLVPNVDVLNLSGIGGITQTAGSLAVANLFLGGKSARLNTATNAIGTIATTLSGALDVNAGGPITVGMVQGHEGIAAGGSVALRATGAVTLDAPIVSNGTGDAVVVAGSTFVNNAGISGIDTVSGRWLVFTPNAGSITAGGLAATNWVGTSIDNYDSGTPVGAGDRFVIATPGTLTITPDSLVTTYGTAGPAPTYSFSGLLPGDSLAAAISGTPSNAGLAIDGGVHVVNATPGSLLSLENYILQFGTGTLTVNKAPLTIQALDVAKSFGTVLTFNGTGFSTNGLIGGDQVSLTTLTSAGAGATAGPGGSPYRIDVSGAQGVGVANYAIRYLPGSLTVTAPLSTAGTGATAIGVLSLPVTLPPPPQPPAVRVPIQLASLNLGLSTGINLSPGSGSPTISDAPAPGLFPAPASPNRSPARPAAQSQPAITDETPPAAPARGPVAESRPSALGPETTTPGGPSLTPGDGPGLASAPASPPMQMASLTTGETPVGNSARQEPTVPPRGRPPTPWLRAMSRRYSPPL